MSTDENGTTLGRVSDAWSSVSGILCSYSTSRIKEILGKAGFPVFKIQYAGTNKRPLLDEADNLVRSRDDDSRAKIVVGCIEEIVALEEDEASRLAKLGGASESQVLEKLEEVLARVGLGLSGRRVFSLSLQLDIEAASLPKAVSIVIAEALRRYRDGRFAGAVTSVCGAVDQITERVFLAKNLGDHKSLAFQEKVSKSFISVEAEYCAPLQQSGVPLNEIKLIWENHKKSVSQAAYVLGAFRRNYSDAHGQQNAPREFVQRSLDCAVFILRSFCGIVN